MKSFYSFLFIQCAILLFTTNISLGNPLDEEFEDEKIGNYNFIIFNCITADFKIEVHRA